CVGGWGVGGGVGEHFVACGGPPGVVATRHPPHCSPLCVGGRHPSTAVKTLSQSQPVAICAGQRRASPCGRVSGDPSFFGHRETFNRQGRPRPPCPKNCTHCHRRIRRIIQPRWWRVVSSRLVATADRVSTTIWSGGAAVGLYLGTGLMLALLVHTHYPGALGLREWIRVILSWPLIFFLRSK